jgi:hypothetical protein
MLTGLVGRLELARMLIAVLELYNVAKTSEIRYFRRRQGEMLEFEGQQCAETQCLFNQKI